MKKQQKFYPFNTFNMIDDVDNDEKNKTLKHLKEENLFHHHVHVEMCPFLVMIEKKSSLSL